MFILTNTFLKKEGSVLDEKLFYYSYYEITKYCFENLW